jgi:hypothetical protein
MIMFYILSNILVHVVMVLSHVFLVASSPVGHDAETKYNVRKCAD